MSSDNDRFFSAARIVWAITLKDLKEALRNKNTITVLITALFMVAVYRGLPMLSASSMQTRVFIYDPGESVLVPLLENQSKLDIRTYTSEEKMKDRLREEETPAMGLTIPAGFDQSLQAGAPLAVQGYILNWISQNDIASLRAEVEFEIARLSGAPVQVNTDGNTVYLEPESGGMGVQATMGLVFIQIMIGISFIPHLFMEEKQTRTLDAILVSPAHNAQVVLAKALVGLFYVLLAAGVAFIINRGLIVHWWLVVLATVCGALFTVAVGLWLGMKIENRAQLSIWAWVLIIPLFFPIIIFLLEGLMPEGLVAAARWIPSTAIFNTTRFAYAESFSPLVPLLWISYILLWAGAVLWAVVWQIRRSDREADGLLSGLRGQTTPSPQIEQNQDAAEPTFPLVEAILQLVPKKNGPAAAGKESWDLKPRSGWRIILAIAAKDIRDMLRNKVSLSIILGTLLIALPNAVLPRLARGAEKPLFVFYEENRSQVIRTLAGRPEYRLQVTDSKTELRGYATGHLGYALILELPEDFDSRAGSAEVIQIQAYYAHWADLEKIREMAALIEAELTQASQTIVQVQVEDHAVFPDLDAGGFPPMSTLIFINVISIMGIALVPLLMVEEKENHTYDAILISPTSFFQLIAGKALAGLAYCLIAAAVVLAMNSQYFVHWGLVSIAVLLMSGFVVALGLLVGMVSDNTTSTGLWGGLLIIVLIGTGMVELIASSDWPQVVQDILKWTPGSLMTDLMNFSMLEKLPLGHLAADMAAFMAMTLAVYILVAWRVVRWERR